MDMNYFFLYDLVTGEIKEPSLTTATEWTNIPTGWGVIGPFDQATDNSTVQDAFNHPTYYTVTNGVLTAKSNIASLQLQDAKNNKITQIEANMSKAMQTFTSSAIGTTKTYLNDPTSWAMLSAEYAYASGPDCTETSIDWYTVEDGKKVTHTTAQIKQVFLDGRAAVKGYESHKDDLIAQVNAATTVNAVNAIANW